MSTYLQNLWLVLRVVGFTGLVIVVLVGGALGAVLLFTGDKDEKWIGVGLMIVGLLVAPLIPIIGPWCVP